MAELKPYRGSYYLWNYVPSTVAAAIFAALFALGSFYIIWRMFRTRAWFCIPFALGGLFELVGYCARAAARDKTDQLTPFIIQNILILVAPALFAASVYMVLGRLIRSLDAESHSVVPVKWLTKIFVFGDVVSFIVQASGGGIMSTGNSIKTGENIILGGLFVQIIIFALFAVTAAIFHARLDRRPTEASLERSSTWRSTMMMLYVVSVLIMVRSIFRVVEYIMGHDGYPLRNEWTLYVFDALLMFGVVVVFAWRFPGGRVPSKSKGRDTGEPSVELQGSVSDLTQLK
ncbi:RTA1 like protein-domain-containing protein [Boeremia exigua]|uniref:RTA1 like protein-domain-containing protein n=1 Tax=Boeremia exigua TaxID=749465 RepID=UPI001E8E91A2|nr:RTA1 like protein-domain-containing protein [Boeremia exigua]KAH6628955.1 RTA1 like protein-domain-containing protein [Boeremia exigua]